MKMFWAFIVLSAVAAGANAGQPVGAFFLNGSPPASVSAMDGDATAVARGADALFTNPAGASDLRGGELSFNHSTGVEGSQMQSFGYAQTVGLGKTSTVIPTKDGPREISGPRRTPMTLGVSAIYDSYGKFQGYDDSGNRSSDFSVSDMSLALSVARKMGSFLSAGMSVKGLEQRAGNISSKGVAADLGLLSKTPWRGLDAAVAITNIGPSMSMSGQSYSLPTEARLGLGYAVSAMTLAADVALPTHGGSSSFGLAFQVRPASVIAFRISYIGQPGAGSTSLDSKDVALARFAGMSAGFGLNVGRYTLDYALVPHQALDATQQISLSAHF